MAVEWHPVRDRKTVAAELDFLAGKCREAGVVGLSYHLTPPFCSQVSKKSSVFHFGYSKALVKAYLDPSVFEHDPIPDFVMSVGHVMTWSQAAASQKLTDNHRCFIARAMSAGLIDGVAVPLFGPLGRNSYLSLNFDRELSLADETIVRPLVSIAQSCHRRICAIVRDAEKLPSLSLRESEVIYWISRGKTNAEISMILGLNQSTIDTYVKRIFQKLSVHDRISAVRRGLEYALINLW